MFWGRMQRADGRDVLPDANALTGQVEPGRRSGPHSGWPLGVGAMVPLATALMPVPSTRLRSSPVAAGIFSWSLWMAPAVLQTRALGSALSTTVKGGARRVAPPRCARGPKGVVATRGGSIEVNATNCVTHTHRQTITPPAVRSAEELSRTSSWPSIISTTINCEKTTAPAPLRSVHLVM